MAGSWGSLHLPDSARVLIGFCGRLGLPFGIDVKASPITLAETEAPVISLARGRGLLH